MTVAAALEAKSEHPFAKAILAAVGENPYPAAVYAKGGCL